MQMNNYAAEPAVPTNTSALPQKLNPGLQSAFCYYFQH